MKAPIKYKSPKNRVLRCFTPRTQQQRVKQKLIEYSETQQNAEHDGFDKFAFILDVSSRGLKKSCDEREPKNKTQIISRLKKYQVEFDKDSSVEKVKRILERSSFSKDRSERMAKSQSKLQKLMEKHPISLSTIQFMLDNYLVSGNRSLKERNQNSSHGGSKSQYIIRQLRNTRKLKRRQQKREQEQILAKTSFYRIISQREGEKVKHMKSNFMGAKHKKYLSDVIEREKEI